MSETRGAKKMKINYKRRKIDIGEIVGKVKYGEKKGK